MEIAMDGTHQDSPVQFYPKTAVQEANLVHPTKRSLHYKVILQKPVQPSSSNPYIISRCWFLLINKESSIKMGMDDSYLEND